MHTCGDCGKSYAIKASLARHERNHKAEACFTCNVCKVSFRRRDLLLRHNRIHGDSVGALPPRRRCHTACDGCKALRRKCDGFSPCSACTQVGKECVYQAQNARLSKPGPDGLHLGSRNVEPVMHAAPAYDNDVRTTVDYTPSGLPPNDGSISRVEELDPSEIDIELSATMDEPSSYAGEMMDDSFWPFSTSWQWTHEDFYFHGDPALDMLEAEFVEASSKASDEANAEQPQDARSAQSSSYERTAVASSRRASMNIRRNLQLDFVTSRAASGERQSPSVLTLKDIVDNLVNLATPKDSDYLFNQPQWHNLVRRLSEILAAKDTFHSGYTNTDLLDHLIDQYFDHFHPLWPLVCNGRYSHADWHPLLYLTLTSIGALYSGTVAATSYGSLMHTSVRNTLIHLPIHNDQKETEALDIGRAMLLTQVAALYFEQKGAFSAAQQLGAALNAHAYRMRLLTLRRTSFQTHLSRMNERDSTLSEGRAMLAYGMLRAETFTSVLLNRKPLLSYEEINLTLPFSGLAAELSSTRGTCQKERSLPCGGFLFSDLVRIALDEDEILPPLRPVDLELLLFGLQHDVWRFSHDPNIFMRLIGTHRSDLQETDPQNTLAPLHLDLLDRATRQMRLLHNDYRRILAALEKWHSALSQTQFTYPAASNRSTYLSGLILYELSLLRLLAPIEGIQQIAYQLHDPATSDEVVLAQVTTWTFSNEAGKAVEHAQSIWRLLDAEISVTRIEQTKFNILSLIGLHHAATVIWAVAGTEGQASLCFESAKHNATNRNERIMLHHDNTRAIMLLYADLYPKITSAWGMQSSFYTMVRNLADHPFPKGADTNDAEPGRQCR